MRPLLHGRPPLRRGVCVSGTFCRFSLSPQINSPEVCRMIQTAKWENVQIHPKRLQVECYSARWRVPSLHALLGITHHVRRGALVQRGAVKSRMRRRTIRLGFSGSMSHPYGLITPTAASDPCFFPVFFRALGCGTGVPGCGVIHTTNKRWQRQHDAAHRRTIKRVRVSCGMIAMGHPITIPLSNRYHTEFALCGKVSGYPFSQVRQETRNGGVFPLPNDPVPQKTVPGGGSRAHTDPFKCTKKRQGAKIHAPTKAKYACCPRVSFPRLPGNTVPGGPSKQYHYGGDEVESTASSQRRTPKKGHEKGSAFSHKPFPRECILPSRDRGFPVRSAWKNVGFGCVESIWWGHIACDVGLAIRPSPARVARSGGEGQTTESKHGFVVASFFARAGLFC